MFFRFGIVLLLVGVVPVTSNGQGNNEILLGSIRGSWSLLACGRDGRTYFDHPASFPNGVLGVSRDGSITSFQLPGKARPLLAARDGSDLSVLSERFVPPHGHDMEIYQFDDRANILGHHPVTIDFYPLQMAVLPSGETIVAGHLGDVSWSHRDQWTYLGAVLGTDGHVIDRFDLPAPPDGGKWTFPGRQKMVAEDGAAYIVLETDSESAIGIAKISKTGNLDIKIIPEPPDNDERIHRSWLLAPGVAVEEYTDKSDRPRYEMHYDEYDLNSGLRIATKYSLGGAAECYLGAEVNWATTSNHVDPSRHPSPNTLWLLFSTLENEAASRPAACH
jgi:hypothetical protein